MLRPFVFLLLVCYRVNGHASDNLQTLGMVVGMTNCGNSLGSTLGPILGGVTVDAMNFPWMTTVLSAASLTMVCPKVKTLEILAIYGI